MTARLPGFDLGEFLATRPPDYVHRLDLMFDLLTHLARALPLLPPGVPGALCDSPTPCRCPDLPMLSCYVANGDWLTMGPLPTSADPATPAFHASVRALRASLHVVWCPACLTVLHLMRTPGPRPL